MQEIIKKLRKDLLKYKKLQRSDKIEVEIYDYIDDVSYKNEKIAEIKRNGLNTFKFFVTNDYSQYPIKICSCKRNPIKDEDMFNTTTLYLNENYVLKIFDQKDSEKYDLVLKSINNLNKDESNDVLKLATIIETFYTNIEDWNVSIIIQKLKGIRKEVFGIEN